MTVNLNQEQVFRNKRSPGFPGERHESLMVLTDGRHTTNTVTRCVLSAVVAGVRRISGEEMLRRSAQEMSRYKGEGDPRAAGVLSCHLLCRHCFRDLEARPHPKAGL